MLGGKTMSIGPSESIGSSDKTAKAKEVLSLINETTHKLVQTANVLGNIKQEDLNVRIAGILVDKLPSISGAESIVLYDTIGAKLTNNRDVTLKEFKQIVMNAKTDESEQEDVMKLLVKVHAACKTWYEEIEKISKKPSVIAEIQQLKKR